MSDLLEPIEDEIVDQNGRVRLDTWRYTCLNCGSVCLVRSGGTRRQRTHEFSMASMRFYCESCGGRSRSVYDKKQGTIIDMNEYFKIINDYE